ncbi:hypothetical protein [Novosphingobium sp. B 225]|nr:hypothetical protein [Novosphingobium sp. B 225]
MSKRLFLFAAWCLIVFAGSVSATYYAWSPFSDEDRGGGGFGGRGPSHK